MEKKILLVDDDAIIRNLMAALLRRKGLTASQAANGDEAIALLKNSRDPTGARSEYDLVILDLMMPLATGQEVIEFIRTELPDMLRHVVVVSAAGEGQLSTLSREELGCVLAKPFDTGEFYATIARCMRGPVDSQFPSVPSWLIAVSRFFPF